MKNTWFTADLHLGHKNILGFEETHRPYASVEEMHAAILKNWNEVVKKGDTVYVLGDVAFGKRNLILLDLLHGSKRLVLGNHDAYPMHEYLRSFDRIYGAKFWQDCLLTHVPVHPSCLGARCFLNVHGHLHSKTILNPLWENLDINSWKRVVIPMDDRNYMCVSLEQNNMTPIHMDVILDRVKELRD